MAQDNFDAEIRASCIQEIKEHLLTLEDHSSDLAQFNFDAFFRAMHSFKGTCASIGWRDLQVMSHKFEDLLVSFRDKKSSITEETLVDFSSLIATLKRGTAKFIQNDQVTFDDPKFWETLEKYQEKKSAVKKVEKSTGDSYQILVLDDEPDIAEVFKDLLEDELPCKVTMCNDPLKALNLTKSVRFDIILTDFNMPGMNGLDFVLELRKTFQTPVIMITGLKPEIKGPYAKLDNIYFLQKPFELKKVEYYIHCGLAMSKAS